MGQAFFHQVDPELEVLLVGLVDPYPPGVVYRKILDLYRKFQFIGNFKVTQYVVTIVRPHFQWLEFHIKIHGMAGKQCFFCPKTWEKVVFFWNFGWNFKCNSVDTLNIKLRENPKRSHSSFG